jgi:hypothetical protein
MREIVIYTKENQIVLKTELEDITKIINMINEEIPNNLGFKINEKEKILEKLK